MDDSIDIPLTVRFRNQTPIDTLTMAASTGQRIIIHLATGEVDLCGLTPSEGASIVAYLHSLKSNPPDEKLRGALAELGALVLARQ